MCKEYFIFLLLQIYQLQRRVNMKKDCCLKHLVSKNKKARPFNEKNKKGKKNNIILLKPKILLVNKINFHKQ